MMQILFSCSIILLSLYLFIQLTTIFSLLYFENDRGAAVSEEELPHISILVAARNEEHNIIRCLQTIADMRYPVDRLQVLVGNDQSEDRTGELVEQFIRNKPHFSLVNITGTLGKARGKANVLAQMAHKATGSIYLITDADICVNPEWASEMVCFFGEQKTGLVSGVTVVEDTGTIGKMQEVDWIYFMGLLKGFVNLGLHCTAVGNNMAITKEAYWSTGGYENIPFSVTEDYKLYKEVRRRGWKTKNILNEKVVNKSSATKNLLRLLHQRKRWLIGGRELPIHWWFIFFIFGSFGPAIAVVFFFNLKLALIIYLVKLVLQSVSIVVMQRKTHVHKNFDSLMTYEIYNVLISLATQVFYLMPVRMKWKERRYGV